MTRQEYANTAMLGILNGRITHVEDGEKERRETLVVWGNGDPISWNHKNVPKMVAKLAFEMADAMLAESGGV